MPKSSPSRPANGTVSRPGEIATSRNARLLLVHTDLVGGGIEKAVVTLARHLPGDRAICYTSSSHPAPPPEEVAAITEAGAQLFEVPTPLVRPTYGRRLLGVIGQYGPDIVHLHGCLPGIWGGWLARRSQGRPLFVYTQHSNHSIDARWLQILARRTFPHLDHIVCVSEAVRADLVSRPGLGTLGSRITVIANGIELEPFRQPMAAEERTALRRELGATDEDWVIGSVGLLWPVKGYQVLLEALAGIVGLLPAARLVLVGRGEQEADLRSLASRLGVPKRVTFAGWRADIPRVLRAFDVYAQPSLSEGLPIAPIEASAAGLPIVATEVGGMVEVVLDGKTGVLVPPADPVSLAAAIVHLAEHPDDAQQMGAAARTRAFECFSATTMARRHLGVYTRLLGQTGFGSRGQGVGVETA